MSLRDLFPRVSPESSERINLKLDEADHAKIERGRGWGPVTVTCRRLNKRFVVTGAPCGLDYCFCDAVVVKGGALQ